MIAFTMSQPTLHTAHWGERAGVVALVLTVHVAVVSAWLMQPEHARVAVSEMSVSVAIRQADAAQPQDRLPPLPAVLPRTVQAAPSPSPAPLSSDPSPPPVAASPVQASSPAVAAAPVHDTSPDYRASYLNNPRPAYPMVARRMGWEGRVVLNVEVLAEGDCGAASVFQSSGHEVLDNAALRTVQGWRFVPASRAGHPVTQWFRVPIQFSLKGNEV